MTFDFGNAPATRQSQSFAKIKSHTRGDRRPGLASIVESAFGRIKRFAAGISEIIRLDTLSIASGFRAS